MVMALELPKAARTYPIFIIALLLILNTMYVIKMIVDAKKKGIVSGLETFQDFLPKQFFSILVMILVYLAVMYFVGFYISTMIFMAGCLLFLHVPKWQILVTTAIILILVYGAFTMFLGVKLPAGIFFR